MGFYFKGELSGIVEKKDQNGNVTKHMLQFVERVGDGLVITEIKSETSDPFFGSYKIGQVYELPTITTNYQGNTYHRVNEDEARALAQEMAKQAK